MENVALEKHYRVKELASIWGFSENSIAKLFATEPGVVRLSSSSGRRKYITLSIPESVAIRVHQRLDCRDLRHDNPATHLLPVRAFLSTARAPKLSTKS
jgi:hypothetical protein